MIDPQRVKEAELEVEAAAQNLKAAEDAFVEAREAWRAAYQVMSEREGRMLSRHDDWNCAMTVLADAKGELEGEAHG